MAGIPLTEQRRSQLLEQLLAQQQQRPQRILSGGELAARLGEQLIRSKKIKKLRKEEADEQKALMDAINNKRQPDTKTTLEGFDDVPSQEVNVPGRISSVKDLPFDQRFKARELQAFEQQLFSKNTTSRPTQIIETKKGDEFVKELVYTDTGEVIKELGRGKRRTESIVDTVEGFSGLTKPTVTKIQDNLVSFESQLVQLDRIEELFDADFLTFFGRTKISVNKFLNKIDPGLGNKKVIGQARRLKENVNQLFNAYRKDITGAAAAMAELEKLKDGILNEDLGPAEFEASLDEFRRRVQQGIAIKVDLLKTGLVPGTKEFGTEFQREWNNQQPSPEPSNKNVDFVYDPATKQFIKTMTQTAEIIGFGVLAFPDSMSEEEIRKAIEENLPQDPRSNFVEGLAQGAASLVDLPASIINAAHEEGKPPVLAGALGITGQNRPAKKPDLPLLTAFLAKQGIEPDPGSGLGKIGSFAGASILPGIGRAAAAKSAAPAARELTSGLLSGTGAAAANVVAPDSAGAELLGAIAAPGAAAGGSAITRGLIRGFGKKGQSFSAALDDFAATGATPSPAQASVKTGVKVVETSVSKIPGGFGAFHIRALKTQQALGNRMRKIAGGGNDSTSAAGRVIQAGLFGDHAGSFVSRFQRRANRLYRNIEKHITPGAPVRSLNTLKAMDDIASPIRGSKALSKALAIPKLNKIRKAFRKEKNMTFETLQDTRSAVGRLLGSGEVISKAPRADLKRLYAALSEDLRVASKAQGPQALKAFERANKFYKAGLKRIDDFIEKLNKKVTPEEVFKNVVSGNGEDATKLFAIKSSLTREEWGFVRQTVMNRMGRAVAGKQDEIGELFSSETFLTNWNKMSPRAKAALFGTNDKTRKALDQVARVTAQIRETGGVLQNPSGTAAGFLNAQTTFSVLGAAGSLGVGVATESAAAGLATLLLGIGANNALARLMTSDWFPIWLARSAAIPVASLPGHIARLSQVVPNNPQDVAAAQWYLQQLTPGLEIEDNK